VSCNLFVYGVLHTNPMTLGTRTGAVLQRLLKLDIAPELVVREWYAGTFFELSDTVQWPGEGRHSGCVTWRKFDLSAWLSSMDLSEATGIYDAGWIPISISVSPQRANISSLISAAVAIAIASEGDHVIEDDGTWVAPRRFTAYEFEAALALTEQSSTVEMAIQRFVARLKSKFPTDASTFFL
jgi:hypothetical protein